MEASKWDSRETAYAEFEIHFHLHGYYLPAKINCDPNDGHAQEGDDNRDITKVVLNGKEIDFSFVSTAVVGFVRDTFLRSDIRPEAVEKTVADMIQRELFQPSVEEWEGE